MSTRRWHPSQPIQAIKINNPLWKWKVNYCIGKIESMLYQRRFVYYLTALENSKKIMSLTLPWKGSSSFRHHSNKGTLGHSGKNKCLFYSRQCPTCPCLCSAKEGGHVAALVNGSQMKAVPMSPSSTLFLRQIISLLLKDRDSTEQSQKLKRDTMSWTK